ncbi:MAG: ISAzo13-like element transposase-related protein [Acidimicrobiales bacterium]
MAAKSTYQLADALSEKGFAVSPNTVGDLLAGMGYSLQGTSKQKEGRQHVDRDAQFGYINSTAGSFLAAGEPVISVDTKKKLRHEVAPSERARRSEARPMPEA